MSKHWTAQALSWLAQSLAPVPHELNELDWKVEQASKKERLVEHLIKRKSLEGGNKFAEYLPYWA